jgi:hypothetical protein
VVDDHGDVLVVSSVRQLVDADLREAVESVAVSWRATTRWMIAPTVSHATR